MVAEDDFLLLLCSLYPLLFQKFYQFYNFYHNILYSSIPSMWIIVDASIVLTNCSDHNFLPNIFSISFSLSLCVSISYVCMCVCVKWALFFLLFLLLQKLTPTCVNRTDFPYFATKTLTNLINDSSQFLSIDYGYRYILIYRNGGYKNKTVMWESKGEEKKVQRNERIVARLKLNLIWKHWIHMT